ncbi:MAG TPA: carboxypeptidase-like regulatory domain-containing protein [Burkholderiales bacterium]|nr:carboxypeptidase-like regulatory domain-containing protein [Burkholderiales bacterium]
MKIHQAILTAVATAAFSFSAYAADSNVAPAQGAQGNVSFITGGVGEDEAAAMKNAAAGYPLELQFVQKALPRDEFLADVKVRITDRSRNVVLDAVATGPYFLAKLPAGNYQIEADHSGVVKRHNVDVRPGRHARAVFVWAATDESRPSMSDNTAGDTVLR